MRDRGYLASPMQSFDGIYRRVLVGAWLSLLLTCGFAAPKQDITFALMDHKSWTARDGAPHAMRALAQDPDGTLWIGTEAGLFNFDGRTFKLFHALPGEPDITGNVNSLVIAHDGALWAATLHGAMRISNGHTVAHAFADGKAIPSLIKVAVAADNSVWGFGRGILVRFGADGIDSDEPTPESADKKSIGGIFIDSSDTLWLTQDNRLYRRKLSGKSYVAADVSADYLFGTAETPDGSFWMSDFDTKQGIARQQRINRDGKLVGRLAITETPNDILYVPDGSLIVATQFDGLRRVRVGAAANSEFDPYKQLPEKFTSANGLAGDGPRSLLLDRDGSIWAANTKGLDRFREAEFIPYVAASSDRWIVCATPTGDMWIASSNAEFANITHGVRTSIGNENGIYHISCSHDGKVWTVDQKDLRLINDGEQTVLPPIPGAAPYGVARIAGGPNDELYAAVQLPKSAEGLWHLKDGKWSHLAGTGVLGTTPQTVYVDSKNRVWAGYRDGFVALPYEPGQPVFSTGSPGLDLVYSVLDTAQGVFVAGTGGLAIIRDAKIQVLHFAEPELARGIGGLIDARNGDLWLNAAQGLVRVRSSEIAAALSDPTHLLQAALVTEGEWVGPVPIVTKDTAARDAEGNLWFATYSGVFHLNPEHLDQRLQRPPDISLRSITVDGTRIAPGTSIGPNPQTLVIQYLGVNLTSPDSVLYRYRLSGLEDDWQDAGHRNEAIYTQLSPGTYTFEVIASNGEGHWSAPLALAPFTVTPSFFQTTWFTLLCVSCVLVGIVVLSMLRIRVITRSMRARVEERADERVQIARDLHDTLMQGVQGLLLNVHVATQKIARDAEARPMLEQALSTADRIIIEGRNRISALRSEHVTDGELCGAIENVCRDLAMGKSTEYSVTRTGHMDLSLNPGVADEVFHIAREALTNAGRYAEGSHIEVVLEYDKRAFRLTCKDDGRGFDPDAQETAGHWGLRGMAERAAKVGGHFQCISAPNRGTRITVVIVAFRAYCEARWTDYLRGVTFKAPCDEPED